MKYNLIELTYLEGMCGGVPEIVKEMIKMFIDQLPETTVKLKNALNNKNWDEVREIAHKAKSSVNIMGLNELSEEMAKLEKLAKNYEQTETYAEIVSHFETVLTEALEELNLAYNSL